MGSRARVDSLAQGAENQRWASLSPCLFVVHQVGACTDTSMAYRTATFGNQFLSGKQLASQRPPACVHAVTQRLAATRLDVTARAGLPSIGMLGTKAGMTQIFTPEGLAIPASVIALDSGNIVTQVHMSAGK